MNKEYIINNNKVIVLDENKNKIERELTDNIREILICENDIEEISNLIFDEKCKIQYSNSVVIFDGYFELSLGLTLGVGMIINLFLNTTPILPIFCGIFFALFTRNGIKQIRKNKINIKISESTINFLTEQLEIQKQKLNKMKLNKENTYIYVLEEDRKLSTSQIIENLKHKLLIIKDYENNKKGFIQDYKNGTLNKLLPFVWSKNDLNFLTELIKNDLINTDSDNLEKKDIKQKHKKK